MSGAEQRQAAAPVMAQDGYNYPISYWICWACERKIHVVFAGTPAGEPCPTCYGPMEYFDGILVDKKPDANSAPQTKGQVDMAQDSAPTPETSVLPANQEPGGVFQGRYPREQCSSCGADIFRAPTEYRKQSVWDWTPREDGGYELHPDGRMIYVKRQPGDLAPRYVSHWATCPSADQHRREKRSAVFPPRLTGEGPRAERPESENILSKMEGF